MIANTLKSAHEGEFTDSYSTPEYITVTVTDPISHEENGKKTYTSYKITTEVRPFIGALIFCCAFKKKSCGLKSLDDLFFALLFLKN